MDPEGALSSLERKSEAGPIAKDKKKLLDIRDEFRKMQYSEAVLKEKGDDLPKTVKDLRDALDEKIKNLVDNDEVEKEHNKRVPGRVLRQEDEKGWIELGWDNERKGKVVKKLQEVLRLSEDKAENIIHMLIAAGKDPGFVMGILNEDKYTNRTSGEYYLRRANFTDSELGEGNVESLAAAKIAHRAVNTVDRETANKYLLLHEDLGLKHFEKSNDYIMRFVLDDEFRTALDYEFDTDLPQDLFDVGWNIMYHNQEQFGLHGKFPVLQMQVETKKVKDAEGIEHETTSGRYVVNQGNYLRWLRERMFYRYDAFETDEVPDFYSLVQINKGQYATVNLATMIFDKSRYFRDETGHEWEQLFNEVFIEPFDVIFDRTYAIEHQKVYDKSEDFAKAWEGWARLSKFTRKINGQSMVDRAMVLPLDFTGKDSDTKVGEAILTMFLGYYNLADLVRLKEVLGEDSKFFTREGWIKAAADYAGGGTAGTGSIKATGMPFVGDYFGESQKFFDEAFNDDGTIKSEKNFLLFINPNWHEFPSQNLEKTLAQILQNAVIEKFRSKEGKNDEEIDQDSLRYAWLKAYSWIGFAGARARNNFKPSGEPSGHHQETRLLMTDAYRMKYENFGGAGNQYTVPMFKQLSIPFFEGTLSENAPAYYQVYEKGKLVTKKRNKTQMEVMLEMRRSDIKCETEKKELKGHFRTKIDQAANEAEKENLKQQLKRQLNGIDDKYKTLHRLFASELEFNDNAMLVYAKNLVGMANPLYDQIMKAKETAFDKFITYDGIFRGPSFNREAWQEALQSKLFTPLRYIFEANGATQLNQKVRAPVYLGKDKEGKQKWEWREQYLGERMIGHQVLDIPTFRKRVRDIPPEEWAAMKKKGYRVRGKWIVRPDGKHEIDYNKVQENKPMVYKQWMLMKLGADLWSHIDRHSTDPTFTLAHYENVVKAIQELSGDFAGTEYDMRGVRITKPLFSKEQIKWLKRISGADKLFFTEFMKALFIGDPRKKEGGFGESTKIILGGIFKA